MNHSSQYEAENNYKPLACEWCGKDIHEQGGVVCLVRLRDCFPGQYVHGYWACKGECDIALSAPFDPTRYDTPWNDIAWLTNPLEYKLWDQRTARLVGDGRISGAAATVVRRLKRELAWVPSKLPTDQDVAQFRLLRMMDGL